MNRETYLTRLAKGLEPLFKQHGATLPPYRVTCGWPSSGGLAAKTRRIGECWSSSASADGTHEIIISMALDDPMTVAATLAHEMVHAAVGIEAGHGAPFRRLALAIGLEGKMTATRAGEAFKQYVAPILEKLGDYPHARIDYEKRKKQSTRLVKAACPSCGYTVRLSRKWFDVGAPICPVDQIEMT